jgi:hypothetical protein
MASTPDPLRIQPPVEFFGGLKQVGCHNYYSSASSTEDKNVYCYTPPPLTLCVHDAVLPLALGQLNHVTYPEDLPFTVFCYAITAGQFQKSKLSLESQTLKGTG